MYGRTLTCAAVCVSVAVFAPLPPAAANFGSTACTGSTDPYDYLPQNCPSVANNGFHAISFNSLGGQIPGIETATQWAIDNVYNPTGMVVYRDETDPYPDVIVGDHDWGDNGFAAWVNCPDDNTGEGGTNPNRWCRGQRLRFNSYWYIHGDYYDTLGNRRRMACHEMGHTVGLRHYDDYHTGTDSCMLRDPRDASAAQLTQHEINTHINSYY